MSPYRNTIDRLVGLHSGALDAWASCSRRAWKPVANCVVIARSISAVEVRTTAPSGAVVERGYLRS
jgi:hypothetical protein